MVKIHANYERKVHFVGQIKVGAIKEGKYTITLLGLGLLNVQSIKKHSHHF